MRIKQFVAASVAAAMLVGACLTLPQVTVSAGDQPAPITKESSQAFREVVKKTLPAVVSISATAKPVKVSRDRPNPHRFEGPMTPDDLRKFMEEMFENDEPPTPRGGFGSGVIVSKDGIILTNNHVVAGADKVDIRLQDGRTFESSEVVTDPKSDLAIVKIDPAKAKDLPVAELGTSENLEIGDWVLAMGAPFGLQGTVTAGIVSAKGRPLGMNLYEDFIQTDAAINPGNSGGPIVDLDGKVVGINTAIRSNTGTFGGIGFAIPADMAKEIMEQLIKYGKVKRGYLGIQMSNADQAVLQKLGLKNGVQVQALTPGDTPARKAGLKGGDIIVTVDGHPIEESKELQRFVTKVPAGKTVQLEVNRDGEMLTIPVTIEEQPEEFGMRNFLTRRSADPSGSVSIEKLGIEVEKADEGVVVTNVEVDSPAEKAGIQKGSVILQAEKKAVNEPSDLQELVDQIELSDGVLMKVRNPDGSTRLVVVQE